MFLHLNYGNLCVLFSVGNQETFTIHFARVNININEKQTKELEIITASATG